MSLKVVYVLLRDPILHSLLTTSKLWVDRNGF